MDAAVIRFDSIKDGQAMMSEQMNSVFNKIHGAMNKCKENGNEKCIIE